MPKPFGQSRPKTSGAGRVNRTLGGEVQALCTATVLDQQEMELARSLEPALSRLATACLGR